MKKITGIVFLILLIPFLCAGNASGSKVSEGLKTTAIRSKIRECEHRFIPPKGDFNLFKKQIAGFHNLGIVSIPVTENLVNKYLDTFTATDRDSAYVLFDNIVYSAVNDFNDSLELNYSTLLDRVNRKLIDPEVTNFRKCLDICGLALFRTEGENFVDVKYDYYYTLFKGRVSAALTDYLKIREKELWQGFSEDAELLISFHQLYKRVITWEKFNAKYPDFFNREDTQLNYAIYLSTLITGMDNSPLFDYDTGTLFPEVNKLYQKIISRRDSLKSTQVINEYYELLKASDFKLPDQLDQFLKENELFSMLGMQPETR